MFVVAVSDGDTFIAYNEEMDRRIVVRLYGVDCPEMKQDFGKQAKDITSNLVIQKYVRLMPVSQDSYGRTVALVRLYDGTTLEEHLVDQGAAWVDSRYCRKGICDDWRKRQRNAQKARIGLWENGQPAAPWVFRHWSK